MKLKFSSKGIIPNTYGSAPLRGKVFRKKNSAQYKAFYNELNVTIPKLIKEQQQAMSKLVPKTFAHNQCIAAIEAAQRRKIELQKYFGNC